MPTANPFDPKSWLISREEFDRHLKIMVGYTEHRLENKPESLMPALYAVTRTPEGKEETTLVMLAVGFNEADEKHAALFKLGQKFKADQKIPLAVFMATEAWLAKNPPPGVQPRHFAGKCEAIVIFGMSLGGKHQELVSIPVQRVGGRMVADASQPKLEPLSVKAFLLEHFYCGFFDGVQAMRS